MIWDTTPTGLGFSAAAGIYRTVPEDSIALDGVGLDGFPEFDTRVDATFTFDDTQFGWAPTGLFRLAASCALAALNPGARFVQLPFQPVQNLGYASGFEGPDPANVEGGTITAFSVSMGGTTLAVADEFDSAAGGYAHTLEGNLPWSVRRGPPASPPYDLLHPPTGFLLRPTPLSWPGQNPLNAANRTVFEFSELDVISWTLGVHTTGLIVTHDYQATGLK